MPVSGLKKDNFIPIYPKLTQDIPNRGMLFLLETWFLAT
jgi:hypothetical protein